MLLTTFHCGRYYYGEESAKIATQGDQATPDQLRFKKILDNIDNLEPSF